MKLFISNPSSDDLNYTGGVSVPAGQTVEVVWTKWFGLFLDPDFISDLKLRNIGIGDGKQVYSFDDQPAFFDRLLKEDNRTTIIRFIENVTLGAGTTIYTVTNGKTFYLTGYDVSAVNTAAAIGRFCLQAGGATSQRIPFIMPQQPIGGQAGALQSAKKFDEAPFPITTDVRAIGLAGTIAASVTIFGYEK